MPISDADRHDAIATATAQCVARGLCSFADAATMIEFFDLGHVMRLPLEGAAGVVEGLRRKQKKADEREARRQARREQRNAAAATAKGHHHRRQGSQEGSDNNNSIKNASSSSPSPPPQTAAAATDSASSSSLSSSASSSPTESSPNLVLRAATEEGCGVGAGNPFFADGGNKSSASASAPAKREGEGGGVDPSDDSEATTWWQPYFIPADLAALEAEAEAAANSAGGGGGGEGTASAVTCTSPYYLASLQQQKKTGGGGEGNGSTEGGALTAPSEGGTTSAYIASRVSYYFSSPRRLALLPFAFAGAALYVTAASAGRFLNAAVVAPISWSVGRSVALASWVREGYALNYAGGGGSVASKEGGDAFSAYEQLMGNAADGSAKPKKPRQRRYRIGGVAAASGWFFDNSAGAGGGSSSSEGDAEGGSDTEEGGGDGDGSAVRRSDRRRASRAVQRRLRLMESSEEKKGSGKKLTKGLRPRWGADEAAMAAHSKAKRKNRPTDASSGIGSTSSSSSSSTDNSDTEEARQRRADATVGTAPQILSSTSVVVPTNSKGHTSPPLSSSPPPPFVAIAGVGGHGTSAPSPLTLNNATAAPTAAATSVVSNASFASSVVSVTRQIVTHLTSDADEGEAADAETEGHHGRNKRRSPARATIVSSASAAGGESDSDSDAGVRDRERRRRQQQVIFLPAMQFLSAKVLAHLSNEAPPSLPPLSTAAASAASDASVPTPTDAAAALPAADGHSSDSSGPSSSSPQPPLPLPPFCRVFTLGEWVELLLSLGVRSGEAVTEHLVLTGHLLPLEVSMVTGIATVADEVSAVAKEGAAEKEIDGEGGSPDADSMKKVRTATTVRSLKALYFPLRSGSSASTATAVPSREEEEDEADAKALAAFKYLAENLALQVGYWEGALGQAEAVLSGLGEEGAELRDALAEVEAAMLRPSSSSAEAAATSGSSSATKGASVVSPAEAEATTAADAHDLRPPSATTQRSQKALANEHARLTARLEALVATNTEVQSDVRILSERIANNKLVAIQCDKVRRRLQATAAVAAVSSPPSGTSVGAALPTSLARMTLRETVAYVEEAMQPFGEGPWPQL